VLCRYAFAIRGQPGDRYGGGGEAQNSTGPVLLVSVGSDIVLDL
jgi:hypothetical protein